MWWLLFLVFVGLVILSRFAYRTYWRRRFAKHFHCKPESAKLEQVFRRLLDLRKAAEDSEPRFYRPGQTPCKPYLGWLEIADAHWIDYYRARRAAIVCRFL